MPSFISHILSQVRRTSSEHNIRQNRVIPLRRISPDNSNRVPVSTPLSLPPINSVPTPQEFSALTTNPPASQNVCTVCYNNISITRPKFTNRCQCKLTFCKQCIMRWLVSNHDNCPTCRKRIFTPNSIKHIKDIYKIFANNNTQSTSQTINRLVQFFENVEHHRSNPRFRPPKKRSHPYRPHRRSSVYTEQNIQHPSLRLSPLNNLPRNRIINYSF